MTIVIHKSATSAQGALDYNLGKWLQDVADIVDSANLEIEPFDDVMGTGPHLIRKTFKIYEENPMIHKNTKNKVLHFSVNPTPEEGADEGKVLAFIREYLREIGYAEQPMVVFRHRDIERRH